MTPRSLLLLLAVAGARAHSLPDADLRLRNGIQTFENIPVTVITQDGIPAFKTADNLPEEPVSRDKVDLSRTGPPQRQEHDSQTPQDVNTEQETVASIKQTISDSQNAIEGVSSGIQSWLTNNQQLQTIKENVQKLQTNFQNQINKLNATLLGLWKPENPTTLEEPVAPVEQQEQQASAIDTMEQGMKAIESRFEMGVKSVVNSVHNLASVKQNVNSTDNSNNPFAAFTQYLQQFQANIASNFNNLTTTIQNYINQNQQGANATNTVPGPSGFFQNIGQGIQNIIGQQNAGSIPSLSPPSEAQSDEQAPATRPPTIWQGIQSSIQNIWRPGQNGAPAQAQPTSQATPNRPIAQAFQGVVNLIQPKPTDKPEATSEGTNQVPENEIQTETKPEDQKQKPVVEATAGPIKQLVQKNPIVQGIASAVNRIQNPERPREVEKEEEKEVVKEEQRLIPKPIHHNHHTHTPAQVTAWSNFVNGLLGNIGALITGTTTTVSNSVNSAITTVGGQVTGLVSSLTGILG